VKRLLESWNRFLKEEQEQTPYFFFDMDGVLVDFANPVANEINKLISGEATPRSKNQTKLLSKIKVSGITGVTAPQIEEITSMKDNKEELNPTQKMISQLLYSIMASPDGEIWRNLPKAIGADEMLDAAAAKGKVYILTAGIGDASDPAKKDWVKQNLSGHKIEDVILSHNKGEVISALGIDPKRAYLIDDRKKHLDSFAAAGGITIAHQPPASNEAVSTTLERIKGI
jgi:FMN phosphatase YigB (HAD superfamily)